MRISTQFRFRSTSLKFSTLILLNFCYGDFYKGLTLKRINFLPESQLTFEEMIVMVTFYRNKLSQKVNRLLKRWLLWRLFKENKLPPRKSIDFWRDDCYGDFIFLSESQLTFEETFVMVTFYRNKLSQKVNWLLKRWFSQDFYLTSLEMVCFYRNKLSQKVHWL